MHQAVNIITKQKRRFKRLFYILSKFLHHAVAISGTGVATPLSSK